MQVRVYVYNTAHSYSITDKYNLILHQTLNAAYYYEPKTATK